jgi:predicted amidophosphoribosyltransferase
MEPGASEILGENHLVCGTCGKTIEPEKTFIHRSKVFCEECCIDVLSSRTRKTHWQYLSSIKADYLIPGKKPQSTNI